MMRKDPDVTEFVCQNRLELVVGQLVDKGVLHRQDEFLTEPIDGFDRTMSAFLGTRVTRTEWGSVRRLRRPSTIL